MTSSSFLRSPKGPSALKPAFFLGTSASSERSGFKLASTGQGQPRQESKPQPSSTVRAASASSVLLASTSTPVLPVGSAKSGPLSRAAYLVADGDSPAALGGGYNTDKMVEAKYGNDIRFDEAWTKGQIKLNPVQGLWASLNKIRHTREELKQSEAPRLWQLPLLGLAGHGVASFIAGLFKLSGQQGLTKAAALTRSSLTSNKIIAAGVLLYALGEWDYFNNRNGVVRTALNTLGQLRKKPDTLEPASPIRIASK